MLASLKSFMLLSMVLGAIITPKQAAKTVSEKVIKDYGKEYYVVDEIKSYKDLGDNYRKYMNELGTAVIDELYVKGIILSNCTVGVKEGNKLVIMPGYTKTKAQREELLKKYDKANKELKEIVKSLKLTDEMSDLEKVEKISDYIYDTIDYDHEAYNNGTWNTKRSKSSWIISSWMGALESKKTVCSGFADLFVKMNEIAGIKSFTMTSEDHAWTVVMIDGQWRFFDLSNNDCLNNKRAYYNMSLNDFADKQAKSASPVIVRKDYNLDECYKGHKEYELINDLRLY